MKRNNTLLIVILIAALVLQGVWIYSLKNSEPNTTMSYSSILESVQSIGELNTLEMYFHDIIEYTENKKFRNLVIPLTTKSFIFTVEAKVKAGVDFNQLDSNSFIVDGDKVEINMPAYKITSVEFLDYNPYSQNDALFNKIKNDDIFAALKDFSSNIKEKAIELGVVEKAKESGEVFMHKFLANLGFEEIIIK